MTSSSHVPRGLSSGWTAQDMGDYWEWNAWHGGDRRWGVSLREAIAHRNAQAALVEMKASAAWKAEDARS